MSRQLIAIRKRSRPQRAESRLGSRNLRLNLQWTVWRLALFLTVWWCATPAQATILWSDLGATLVKESGAGGDIRRGSS